MTSFPARRRVTSVLVEEGEGVVVVTWGLGDIVAMDGVEYFGGEVYYYGPDGNGGKRFGVKFYANAATTAHVWDNGSNTQANYGASAVTASSDSIVARYNDADLGLDEIGTIAAYAQINGKDEQLNIAVTLLR